MAVRLPLGVPMRLSKSKADLYAAIRRDHRAGMSMPSPDITKKSAPRPPLRHPIPEPLRVPFIVLPVPHACVLETGDRRDLGRGRS